MKQVIKTTMALFALLIILGSCNQSGKNESGTENAISDSTQTQSVENYSVTLPDKSFNVDNYFVNIEKMTKMTSEQFNAYQINRIEEFKNVSSEPNDGLSFSLAETLWESGKAKAIIVVENSAGESGGFLITYDNQGNYVSSEKIVYEDCVEYYTMISSVIKNNVIEVKTVNHEYLDDDSEKSDSTIVKYTIDQSLKINKQ